MKSMLPTWRLTKLMTIRPLCSGANPAAHKQKQIGAALLAERDLNQRERRENT